MRKGELIDARFELEEHAGEGGMGTVWRALDRRSSQPVALKILRDPEGHAARFRHEAQILAGLDHPHIVRFVAHGIAPSGEAYLAMEWLSGESLEARITRAPLSLEEALDLARRVAGALGVAHARGVVHRDIKPSNLILVGGAVERVKVLDFGIARRADATRRLTRSGSILGTPGYMAPEQARGDDALGPPIDVFALGCVIFECVAGVPAFQGAHPMALLAKLLLEDPPRLRELRPEVPEALSDLVARLCAKDPSARPADGAAALAALSRIELRPDEDGARSDSSGVASITGTERRLVSIVAVAPPRDRQGSAPPRELLEAVRRAAVPLGAKVTELLNGVVIAVLLGEDSVTDQAVAAARCALWVKAAVPDGAIVLVTGRGEAARALPVGEALEQAAALLDELAPAEGGAAVRLDEITRALLDSRFDVTEEQGRILLRGERQTGDEARTLLGRQSPFVGREREARSILDLIEESFEERRSIAVVVTAPPGMGKSRLRQEVVRRVQKRHPDVALTMARPDVIGAGSAFAMLARSLRDALQITGGEPSIAQREKVKLLTSILPLGDEAPRITEFIGELAGAPFPDEDSPRLRAARQSPQLMADQIQAAYVDLTRVVAATRPVLVVLEDLHWGDAPSVKILDAALRDLDDQPLVVLAFARPEVHELFPRLWAGRNAQEYRLVSLSRRAATELVEAALGASVDPARVAAIVERAEGNALYLEELIRAVAEGRGEALPDTVLGMVEARLSALSPGARRLLRAASVFGQVFWRRGVHELVRDEPSIELALAELCAAELCARRMHARFAGEEEYALRHELIREGAYAMLTARDRTLGHRLAGEWLEQAGEVDALVLAEHFERGEDAPRAAQHYLRAGSQSFDRNDLDCALRRAERGIGCGAEGEVLGNLRALIAMARCWRSELDLGLQASLAASPLVRPGSRWECIVLFHGAWAALVTGADDDFADMAGRFARFAPDAEARRDYLLWAPLAASLLTTYGRRELCKMLLDRAEALAQAMPTVDLGLRGALAIGKSDHARAFERASSRQLELAQEAVEAFEKIGDLRNEVTARSRLGQAQGELGDAGAGEATLRRAVELARRIRGPFAERQAELHLAALLSAGADEAKWAEAEEIARRVLAAPGVSDGYRGWSHGIVSQVLLHRGQVEEAVGEARAASALCARLPQRRIWVMTLLIRGLVALDRIAEARALAGEIEGELTRLGGGGYIEADARRALALTPAAARSPA